MPSSFNLPEHDVLRDLLKKARIKAGLSQRELSVRLGESYNFLNKVESGVRGIDLVGVIRLLKITGTDRQQFFEELFQRIDRL